MQSPVKQAILEELDTYKEEEKNIFFSILFFLSFLFLRQKSICELKIKDNLSGWMSWLMTSNPQTYQTFSHSWRKSESLTSSVC